SSPQRLRQKRPVINHLRACWFPALPGLAIDSLYCDALAHIFSRGHLVVSACSEPSLTPPVLSPIWSSYFGTTSTQIFLERLICAHCHSRPPFAFSATWQAHKDKIC